AGRQFPDYYAKFGEENVTCVLWDKTCTDLEAHIVYLKKYFPKDKPFIAVGHSMGGSILLEICSRELIPNMKGLVLVGAAQTLRVDGGVRFMMKRHWFRITWLVCFLTAIAPIMVFIWRKKTYDTYKELWRFTTNDGAKKIHTQYNQTIKRLGGITSVKNPDMPFMFVRLEEDTLVDNDDLNFTRTLFKNIRDKIIETNSLHLTEKFDHLTVEKIAEEAEFIGLIRKKKDKEPKKELKS
ncbi:MAG: alpha/beta fold hydrolase, partial [Candidatus Heimdallarchaeota archaeon]